jgi:hypothetical protein
LGGSIPPKLGNRYSVYLKAVFLNRLSSRGSRQDKDILFFEDPHPISNFILLALKPRWYHTESPKMKAGAKMIFSIVKKFYFEAKTKFAIGELFQ